MKRILHSDPRYAAFLKKMHLPALLKNVLSLRRLDVNHTHSNLLIARILAC